jgi:hypothetical protein
MTTNSPSSGAESASSTIDPDARARRANDGELNAGFQSDQTVAEDADGLFTAEELAAEFDENRRQRWSTSLPRPKSTTKTISSPPPIAPRAIT